MNPDTDDPQPSNSNQNVGPSVDSRGAGPGQNGYPQKTDGTHTVSFASH